MPDGHPKETSSELGKVILAGLNDRQTGWSMGSFGAIAEFHQVEGDPGALWPDVFTRVTDRGGVAFTDLTDCTAVAYETLSPKPDRWGQSVALCLPEAAARMSRRKVLTALGPDHGALLPEHRGAMLFDMGLDQPQVDFCIRTDDPQLIDVLTQAEGQSLFTPGNPAMPAIMAAHPHRIAVTRIGRVEVFQKIGGPDTGGKSPVGPHTHILPKLMATGRTHSANTPIPEGLVPVAGLHPASALSDQLGRDKPWDPAAFAAFQALFRDWAPSGQAELKALVRDLIAAGSQPDDFAPPPGRHMRAAVRIAIRQAAREDGETPTLSAWRALFDGAAKPEDLPPEHPA